MSYSVVLLSQASEAVFQTALKRWEESGGEPQPPHIAMGEVLADIAAEEGAPLLLALVDRETRKILDVIAKTRAQIDATEQLIMKVKSR